MTFITLTSLTSAAFNTSPFSSKAMAATLPALTVASVIGRGAISSGSTVVPSGSSASLTALTAAEAMIFSESAACPFWSNSISEGVTPSALIISAVFSLAAALSSSVAVVISTDITLGAIVSTFAGISSSSGAMGFAFGSFSLINVSTLTYSSLSSLAVILYFAPPSSSMIIPLPPETQSLPSG